MKGSESNVVAYLYEAYPTDLVFYLKEESDIIDVSLVGTRYEVRKKYWSFAFGQN